ncbi:MAG: hypothetical protein M1130_13080 [Actinobacteria bacterium]|nr:hypothetical protein [Actinomycetota bacterium]
MTDKKDKPKAEAKGIDVSGYMPGPASPYPPASGPPPAYMPGPGCPEEHEKMDMYDTLACKLKKLMGQQVTVYVMGMGPVAPVPTIPTGGPVVTGAGAIGITGILHHVGMDFLELHVMMGGNMRVVYIPLMAVAAVVPGGPLLMDMETNVVTTFPTTL